VVSGRLNVKCLKRTNQIVDFGRNQHIISLYAIPVRIYLTGDHSKYLDTQYALDCLLCELRQ
jgi:hypothetical protein